MKQLLFSVAPILCCGNDNNHDGVVMQRWLGCLSWRARSKHICPVLCDCLFSPMPLTLPSALLLASCIASHLARPCLAQGSFSQIFVGLCLSAASLSVQVGCSPCMSLHEPRTYANEDRPVRMLTPLCVCCARKIRLSPYKLVEDNHLKAATEVVIFLTLLVALMLKTSAGDASSGELLSVAMYDALLVLAFVVGLPVAFMATVLRKKGQMAAAGRRLTAAETSPSAERQVRVSAHQCACAEPSG